MTLLQKRWKLSVISSTNKAHAVNLIFDKENGTYSFEDDNVGRVNYSSLKELQEQGTAYFKTYYEAHFPALEFECYSIA